jgi:hypothetical protein
MDERHYSNADLAYALDHVGGFAKTQDGWVEQRRYVDHTLNALRVGAAAGDEGCAWLLRRTEAELAMLKPTAEPIVNATKTTTTTTTTTTTREAVAAEAAAGGRGDPHWVEIDATAEISDLPQWSTLAWNASAGGLAKLVHKGSGHNYARAGGRGSLAQYQYETLDEDDFWTFMNAVSVTTTVCIRQICVALRIWLTHATPVVAI